MATNNKISTTELGFDNIKSNIKQFFQGQEEFSDYDFEGSGLSILLDVLSYNTHYNSLYTNLAVNESFLDSAVKRESVVSKAFELGYLPRSASASRAKVNVKLTNVANSPDTLVIGALTPFSTSVNGILYTFYNVSPYTTTNTAGTYNFNNIELVEGTPLSQSYVVSPQTRYIISNINCDISTLTVDVLTSINSNQTSKFTRVDDILTVTASDPVYFIKEIEDGRYEIQFGNDRIGKSVDTGNIVNLSYFVTNKENANGAKVFNSGSLSNSVIITTMPSRGGAEAETIEEIKHNSPRFYSASNRAVTNEDYKSIITNNFPNVDSIQVWGGDENFPPIYGKVFISIAPKDNTILTENEKTIIKEEILKSRKIVTITPEFVDPFYLNISLNTTLYYDPNTTTQTANALVTQVKNNILNYNNTYLKRFDSIFRYSKLMSIIDSTDQAITSNISSLTVYRKVMAKFNLIANYTFHIDNPIYSAGVSENAVTTNGFYVSGDSNIQYIKDDGLGTLQRYYLDTSNNVVITKTDQGTVTYSNGEINIVSLNITRLAQADLIFSLKLQSNDIISVREHIVRIDPVQLEVNAIAETKVVGSQYIFTPSR